MKRISIILCTCNGEAYLAEQLDSLLRQTLPFDELIIQDDASTDGTCQLVKGYQARHPDRNICLHINPSRLGYSRNFLTAIQRATGDYIACCDQDDIWFDQKLEVLLQHMEDCSLIFHNSILLNDRHEELGLLYACPFPEYPSPLSSALYPHAYGHTLLFTAAVKERLASLGIPSASYDYLIYSVAAATGPVRYLASPLVYWRRHEEAATYSPVSITTSKWKGYLRALQAFCNPENRKRTRFYFSLLSRLPFYDAIAQKAVRNMASGTALGIIRTCILCGLHASAAAQEALGMTRLARAFFLPLFFIRDHGRYIIQINKS